MVKTFDDLSLENQTNYEELLVYLMNYALHHNIGVEWTRELPPYAPPVSFDRPGKLIIMNANWNNIVDIPFQFAHEIGHVLHESSQYYNLNKRTTNKGEDFANKFAIKLLQQYCINHEYHYSTWFSFARAFKIPSHLFYLFSSIRIKNV